MAKQIIQKLIDDLDGGEATETVTFALDGVSYTIDLSEKNATKLREVLAPYQGAGAKIGRSAGTWRPGLGPKVSRNNRTDNAAIRSWASENGYELADRGRIPANVVEAYEARETSNRKPAAGAGATAKATRRTAKKAAVAA
jgi:Lsr2